MNESRTMRRDLGQCIRMGCETVPDINPRTQKPFTKCRKHRIEQCALAAAWYRKKHAKP